MTGRGGKDPASAGQAYDLHVPPAPRAVMAALEAAGMKAWAVGGCIRDTLLLRRPIDWDIATAARPEDTRAALEAAGMQVIDTGLRHGTVTALVPPGQEGPKGSSGTAVEVTTRRIDGPYGDGRRPDGVAFTSSLEADLSRRDFTINAMAWREGRLADPFGGRADLAAGLVRAVGPPGRRFEEDGLRVLRALRFAAQLGFEVESATARAVHSHKDMLARVSAERISRELMLLLAGPACAAVLREFGDVVAVFIPEIAPTMGFDQRNSHHIYDVWEHTLHALEVALPDPVVGIALLLHDLGKPRCFTVDSGGTGHFYGHGEASCRLAADILERLRLDRRTREQVLALVKYHDSDLLATPPSILRWLRRLGRQGLGRLIAVKRADNLAQSPCYSRQADLDAAQAVLDGLDDRDLCLTAADLAISGRDILALGAPPGPGVGDVLSAALEAVTDGLPNTREALLALARAELARTQ